VDEPVEPGQPWPLVGRGAELDDLDGLLAAAAAREGAVVLLEGEAGIGRTRLVEALAHGAEMLDVSLVVLRFPGPSAVDVERLLGGRTDRPRAVVLDDVHLADDASLEVLGRYAHSGPIPATLLVLTERPVPHRVAVQRMVVAWVRAGARNLELRPLAPAATVELAEQLVGHPVGPLLRGVLSTAGGNPRLVTAVVRAVEHAGALGRHGDGVLDIEGTDWQHELDDAARAHIADLDPAVLELLSQAAVLGPSFVVPDLAALAGQPLTECWRTLRHALAAGVVAARGDRLVFRHDLVRTALYAGLDEPTRRALHARAAATLGEAGAPPHVVAAHRERARAAGPA
jgi:predicted ATPase